MTELDSSGGVSSYVTGINDHGVIIGAIGDAFGLWAPMRWRSGAAEPLRQGSALAINNRGEILLNGLPDGKSDSTHLLLIRGGRYLDVSRSWWGYTVNDRGQIALGLKDRPVGALPQTFVWENGHAWNLGNLGARDNYPTGINDHGQVVGSASTRTGQQHAVLWTPRRGT
jgi:probable HAF family extracellular repeat protein